MWPTGITPFISLAVKTQRFISYPWAPMVVLGGGDDGPMTHFDTASLGFGILEGLGYNRNNGTLLLASPKSGDLY